MLAVFASSSSEAFDDRGNKLPTKFDAKAKVIRYTREMTAGSSDSSSSRDPFKERFSRLWRFTASKMGIQQYIERKVFENITFNSARGLRKFKDMLLWCPSGAARIHNLTFQVNYLHEDEPNEDVRNYFSFTNDLDFLIRVLHNHQATHRNMGGVNLVLTTERWNRTTHAVDEDTLLPLRYMAGTMPYELDFVSGLEVSGEINPHSILQIISNFPTLEKCTIKLKDRGLPHGNALPWRDEVASAVFPHTFPQVDHLHVEVANTGHHLRNNNTFPRDLYESSTDSLTVRLRDISTRCRSVFIVCPRITTYILWPTPPSSLTTHSQSPRWRYLEEIRIQYEPVATQNGAMFRPELEGMSAILNPIFAAAGRAARRMPRLQYMKISVKLGANVDYYLQLDAHGQHANVELALKVPKRTAVYDVDEEVMSAWGIESKAQFWLRASGTGEVDFVYEMADVPGYEF